MHKVNANGKSIQKRKKKKKSNSLHNSFPVEPEETVTEEIT
jgi:hypothetical protein